MKHGQWWALGVAVAAVAAVAAHPATGWLVRSHVGVLVGGSVPGFAPMGAGSGPESGTAATTPPPVLGNDPELAFAKAVRYYHATSITIGDSVDPASVSGRLAPLVDAVRAFPEYAPPRAAYLRLATQGAVRIGREDELRRAEGRKPVSAPAARTAPAPRREDLAVFDRIAADGERFNPANAYFPTMRAIGHLAGGEDARAWDDLARAATKGTWREYVPAEAQAGDRLALESAGGRGIGAIARIARGAAILYPHYAAIRSVARLALAEAMRRETSGDVAGGIALRGAMISVGRRMRDDSTSLIGNLVGIAVVAIMESRPEGAPGAKIMDKTEEQRRADEDKRNAKFADWLARNGASAATVQAVRDDLVVARRIKSISQRGIDKGVFELAKLATTVVAMIAGVLVLGNIIQMLVVRGVAEVAARATAIARGGRLAPGSFIGGVIVALVLQLPAAVLVGRSLGQAAVAMRAFTAGGATTDDTLGLWAGASIGAASTLLAPTLACGFLLLRAALTRKASFSRTVVLGMRGAALPMVAFLAVGYAGAVAWGAARDAATDREWQRSLEHEGREFARIVGERWPGDR
ncbi:MAG: hypothetical protein ACKO5K_10190 [Armatimonadota bacterium]